MRQNQISACILYLLTIGVLIVASAKPTAFCPSNTCQSRRWSLHHRHNNIQSTLSWSHPRPTVVGATVNVNSEGNSGGTDDDTILKEQKEILSHVMAQSQIMHAMLAVPDVNATVDYWKRRGATLQSYRSSRNAETAFVGFSDLFSDTGFFSLEIVTLANDAILNVGNAISHFGLSMLLDLDLEKAAAGESPASTSLTDVDPNGIQVRSVAAAPGDPFSRFCLRTAAGGAVNGDEEEDDLLAKTIEFYEQLGMTVVAGDETCTCLRYTTTQKEDSTLQREGVAMTLSFERRPDAEDNIDLDIGNCFDHFAFSTRNVDVATEALRAIFRSQGSGEDDISKFIFMEPARMFGMKLVGLYDPNGYKVYLVEDPKLTKN